MDTKVRKRQLTLVGHLTDRLLDTDNERIGRRRCTPSQFDRNEEGQCPFCKGKGNLVQVDLNLIISDRFLSPCELDFYKEETRLLLSPVWSRLTQTLGFYEKEGVAKLFTPRTKWDPCDWGILLHGYPWNKFLIPGRKGKKNVDYYEFLGLVPLVLSRLHLSKKKKWANMVQNSLSEKKCYYCNGSGFDWPVQYYRLGKHSVANWLTSRTHEELRNFLVNYSSKRFSRVLADLLGQLVDFGLGGVKVGEYCRDLSSKKLSRLRSLAICQLSSAEATYCAEGMEVNNQKNDPAIKLLEKVASDCAIVIKSN